jgi:type VI secretion system secreted protein Hcp
MKALQKLTGAATAAALLTSALIASAALDASIKVTGAKQGAFKHQNTVNVAHGGDYTVVAVSHEIVSPRDPQSGLPTGQRMHKPIVVTIDVDATSRKPWDDALAAAEKEPTVELEFFRPASAGLPPTKYYDVTLTDAVVGKLEVAPPDPNDKTFVAGHQRLKVTFTYQKITWTWTDGGKTFSDDDWGHAGF